MGLSFSVISGISLSECGAEESDDNGEEEPDMTALNFDAIRSERGSYVQYCRVSGVSSVPSTTAVLKTQDAVTCRKMHTDVHQGNGTQRC